MKHSSPYFLLLAVGLFPSCETVFPAEPEENEVLDGTVEGLTAEQNSLHLLGDAAFNEVFTSAKGLGPIFVATSCISCHPGDGKGHPFTTLTRFGQNDTSGNQFLAFGGPQLQDRAIPGFTPEGIPAGAPFSKFTPPAATGLGFLEAVTDADLLALADPDDADGDGISGRVNWIEIPGYLTPSSDHQSQSGKYIGRFGKKAAAFNLTHQTVNAYIEDIGISSEYHPQDLYSVQNGAAGTDGIADPEVSGATVNNLVFYLQTLKAPLRRNQNDGPVKAGENLFLQIGCESCHKQTLTTGFSPIAPISYQQFSPYTDLLLHHMGNDLDDGYTEGSATTAEWRTPPLWGLGLSKDSQGGVYYLMHDGRAQSIDEAILLHGGEGEASRNNFLQLTEAEKQQLIAFLESL
jgi:CxxC motif-containing protein (DUF1111 family)